MRHCSEEAEPSSAASRVTVRPIVSPEELIRVHDVISAQLPSRHSAPAHGLDALMVRFSEDRGLMLIAESEGRCIGGALALRVGDAVKVDAMALELTVRGRGIGRRLMEAIE